ncbi:MAG: hypothetical protein JRJ23_03475 [Deltaproteobacteria bacterium]|nr:hypothetical protein [Deltaproteobacteria bacterium]
MIIYDGKYSWNGKKEDEHTPISWWPGSCMLKIIDRSNVASQKNVVLAKPVLVLTAETGEGYSVKSHYQDFAKAVCRDFHLEMKRILWVEYYPGKPGQIDIVLFDPITRIGSEVQFSVHFRPITEREFEEINMYLPESVKYYERKTFNRSH